MVIRGLPFSLHSITKSSNALLVHLPIRVCLLTFAMCLPLFRGAWSAFSETWYKESWKCSWVISLFKGKILMIVSKIWRKFWRGVLRRVSFWIGRNVTCWDWATKSKIWCNKVRLNYPFVISLVYWHWFEHLTHVSYIVHDFGALRVAQKIQSMGSL